MPDFAVGTTFKGNDRLTLVFKKMGVAVKGFTNSGVRGMRRLDGAMNRVGRKIGSALINPIKSFIPLLGVAGFAKLGNDALNLASDLTEVQNVVDTTFGKGAKQIDRWAKTTIKQFGLSELMTKQFAGTFGSMAKSSGLAESQVLEMTQAVVGLSGDYASFRNMEPGQVFEKMQSIITGTTQPLRELGFNMTVATMEAFNLSRGVTKSWKSMSQAEQIMTRYNYIMANSKDAQGDFAKTLATSYANQKRVMGVQFDQMLANVATKILPRLTNGFAMINEYIASIDTEKVGMWLDRFVTALPYIVGGFVAWKIAMASVWIIQKIMIASGWIKYLWMMRTAIIKATFATKAWAVVQKVLNFIMNMNPIFLIITAVAALAAGVIYLVQNWEEVKKSMADTWWGDAILAVIDVIKKAIEGVTWVFKELKKELNARIAGPEAQKKLAEDRMKNWFGVDPKKAEQMEKSMFPGLSALRAPNEAASKQQIDFQGNINVNAPSGTSISSKTRGARPVNMQLVGAQ